MHTQWSSRGFETRFLYCYKNKQKSNCVLSLFLLASSSPLYNITKLYQVLPSGLEKSYFNGRRRGNKRSWEGEKVCWVYPIVSQKMLQCPKRVMMMPSFWTVSHSSFPFNFILLSLSLTLFQSCIATTTITIFCYYLLSFNSGKTPKLRTRWTDLSPLPPLSSLLSSAHPDSLLSSSCMKWGRGRDDVSFPLHRFSTSFSQTHPYQSLSSPNPWCVSLTSFCFPPSLALSFS